MIKSWRHKGLRDFYLTGNTAGIIVEHAFRLKVVLQAIDAATQAKQLNLPGFKFHKLKGELNVYFGITVRANWRIIFQFKDKDAYLVDYLDYH